MGRRLVVLIVGTPVLLAIVLVLEIGLRPPRPGVSFTNYQRIRLGMARAEVEAILGGPPKPCAGFEVPLPFLALEQGLRCSAGLKIPRRPSNLEDWVITPSGSYPPDWTWAGSAELWSDNRDVAIAVTFDETGVVIWKGIACAQPTFFTRLRRFLGYY
jgi:hypothetical protein